MRFVTLNLDLQDARVVRQVVAAGLAGCRCRSQVERDACDSCSALSAVLDDLDRMLSRPLLTRCRLARSLPDEYNLGHPRESASPTLSMSQAEHHLHLLPQAEKA